MIRSDRAETEVAEFLQPHSCVNFSGIDVALGIHGEAVHRGEVSGESAAAAGLCQHFARAPQERPDVLVLAVGVEEVRLLSVGGQSCVVRGAVAEGVAVSEEFADESPVLLEHLNPVVQAVADVDEAIARHCHTVNRRAELLSERCVGVVRTGIDVVRHVAVGAPVALVLPRGRVDDDDAPVLVAIGNVELVGRAVQVHLGWTTEKRCPVRRKLHRVTAAPHPGPADLHHERAVAR